MGDKMGVYENRGPLISTPNSGIPLSDTPSSPPWRTLAPGRSRVSHLSKSRRHRDFSCTQTCRRRQGRFMSSWCQAHLYLAGPRREDVESKAEDRKRPALEAKLIATILRHVS